MGAGGWGLGAGGGAWAGALVILELFWVILESYWVILGHPGVILPQTAVSSRSWAILDSRDLAALIMEIWLEILET